MSRLGNKQRALVAEGGGMRGAYVGGVLSSIAKAAGRDYFDRVYGVSAGAFSGSLFVAGQPDTITHIWREKLNEDKFLNWSNAFLLRPIMDLDYLVGLLEGGKTYLDLKALKNSKTKLSVVATDYKTGHPEYLEGNSGDVLDKLKASSALKFLYNTSVYIDGRRYIDGSYADGLPVLRAIADGYKQIVVVRSRPKHESTKAISLLARWAHFPFSRALRQSAARKADNYARALEMIQNPPKGVNIYQIAPDHLEIGKCTTEKALLEEAVQQGIRDGKKDFSAILNSLNGK